ncbi:DNA sulfur modification protein DndB [Photobacterium profundum]|uniref:DNA sulfur modification protein DndB n=1 Tax=Photobacterium profundum TaxID=74109 RepID=UPI003D10EFAD
MSTNVGGLKAELYGQAHESKCGKTKQFIVVGKVPDVIHLNSYHQLTPELKRLYNEAQRATTPARIRALEDYLYTHLKEIADVAGIIPPLTVVHMDCVELEVSEDPRMLSKLTIDPTKCFFADGKGRVTAFTILLNLLDPSMAKVDKNVSTERLKRRREMYDLLKNMDITVTYVIGADGEPLTERDVKQIFVDINLSLSKLTPGKVAHLNSLDPVVDFARKIGGLKVIQHLGGMSEKDQSMGQKEICITLNILQKFLLAVIGGKSMQNKSTSLREFADGRILSAEICKKYQKPAEIFLKAYFGEIAETYHDDKYSFHRNATTWHAMGLAVNQVLRSMSGKPTIEVHAMLHEMGVLCGRIDYSKASPHWSSATELMAQGADGKYFLLGRGSATWKLNWARYFCSKVGLNYIDS